MHPKISGSENPLRIKQSYSQGVNHLLLSGGAKNFVSHWLLHVDAFFVLPFHWTKDERLTRKSKKSGRLEWMDGPRAELYLLLQQQGRGASCLSPYRSIHLDYRQTLFLGGINSQLHIQNRATRRKLELPLQKQISGNFSSKSLVTDTDSLLNYN